MWRDHGQTRGMRIAAWLVIGVTACRASSNDATSTSPPPFPLRFGDCAAATERFVSGPLPFVATPSPPPAPAFDEDEQRTINTPEANERWIAQSLLRTTVSGGGPGALLDAPIRRRQALPTTSLGQPTKTGGDLEPAILRRYVKRNIQRISQCYDNEVLAHPEIEGTLTAQFSVAPDGHVTSATAAGVSPEVATCVVAIVRDIEFPKPKDGAEVAATISFTLRPPGGSPPRSAPAPSPYRTDELFGGSHDLSSVGLASPLITIRDPLVACATASPAKFGAAVVELAYEPTGSVGAATVFGIDDPTLKACVLAAASRITRPGSGSGAGRQRCSFAFGDMPISALATIDVSEGTVGAPAAAVRPWPATELVVRDPFMVRADDATPMKTVTETWLSILEAGDDFVLAARRAEGWKLLRPMTFPVVPVPFGSGRHWAPLIGSAPPNTVDDLVTLSITITATEVWVGFARTNVLEPISRDEHVGENLRAVLARHKRSTWFAAQPRIEIAADDDVTWGAMVMAIDAAGAAGFPDWRITLPALLRARPQL